MAESTNPLAVVREALESIARNEWVLQSRHDARRALAALDEMDARHEREDGSDAHVMRGDAHRAAAGEERDAPAYEWRARFEDNFDGQRARTEVAARASAARQLTQRWDGEVNAEPVDWRRLKKAAAAPADEVLAGGDVPECGEGDALASASGLAERAADHLLHDEGCASGSKCDCIVREIRAALRADLSERMKALAIAAMSPGGEGSTRPAPERGDRLYQALALFDVRDGSSLSAIVQAAREGWERSAPHMNESGAWDRFDSLFGVYTPSHWDGVSDLDSLVAWLLTDGPTVQAGAVLERLEGMGANVPSYDPEEWRETLRRVEAFERASASSDTREEWRLLAADGEVVWGPTRGPCPPGARHRAALREDDRIQRRVVTTGPWVDVPLTSEEGER